MCSYRDGGAKDLSLMCSYRDSGAKDLSFNLCYFFGVILARCELVLKEGGREKINKG